MLDMSDSNTKEEMLAMKAYLEIFMNEFISTEAIKKSNTDPPSRVAPGCLFRQVPT